MKRSAAILRHLVTTLLFLGVGSLLYMQNGCARIVPPSGGPKDTLPPVLVRALPKDSMLRMPLTGARILITFDEYIQQLDNATQNVVMNPIPKILPIYESKLKTISVKIKDTLEPNTTYSINFGNTVKDVDEGNVLKNFTYIFSTGSVLDSGFLYGKVRLAKNNKVDSSMIVVLHRHSDDSAVAKETPRYMARLDSMGRFRFRHIATGTYSIYALKDEGDKKYRDKSALFAFYDNSITVQSNPSPADSILLYAYAEEGPKPKTTSNNNKVNNNAKKGKKEEKKLHLATSLQGGKQDLLSNLVLSYDQPIDSVDSTLLHLTDTLYNPLPYTFSRGTDTTREKFTIQYQMPWPEDTYFKLIIGRKFAVDTSGVSLLKSDTIAFKTQKESEYGSLLLRLRNFDLKRHPVLQLVQNDKVVDSIRVTGPEISRPLYHPGDYEIRVLYDANQNGTWDPGSFFGIHRQPEIVTQPQKPKIRVRGNGWENEYDVIL